MDCNLPGSSVYGIFQAIVLERIAISFSKGSSQPKDQTRVSRIVDRRFTIWATGEVRELIVVKKYIIHHTLQAPKHSAVYLLVPSFSCFFGPPGSSFLCRDVLFLFLILFPLSAFQFQLKYHFLSEGTLKSISFLYSTQWLPALTSLIFVLCRSFLGFPGGSDGKASACNAGDPGSIPGSGRSPGEGNGNPLQHSCLENLMDGGAW